MCRKGVSVWSVQPRVPFISVSAVEEQCSLGSVCNRGFCTALSPVHTAVGDPVKPPAGESQRQRRWPHHVGASRRADDPRG